MVFVRADLTPSFSSICFERPKSVSFRWPSTPIITFSGLRSRKMTSCACTCSSASATSAAYTTTHSSGRRPLASSSW